MSCLFVTSSEQDTAITTMSERANQEWLEAAQETFGEALEDKRFSFARDIISDTRDAGFETAANQMEALLVQSEKNI